MIRDDPILGTTKRCPRCLEWWPLDTEFWYRFRSTGKWSGYCRACASEVSVLSHRRARAAA